MSDEWTTKTVIGRSTRGGSGAGSRDTVIRGQGTLNAARRSGADIDTSRKYAGSNAKGSSDGQMMTRVDRADDVVKQAQIPAEVKLWLPKIRTAARDKNDKPISQADLARLCGTTEPVIRHIESSKKELPPSVTAQKFNDIMTKAENNLKHFLRGKQAGEPKLNKREKEELEKKLAEEKKLAKAAAKKEKEEAEAKALKEKEEAEAEAARLQKEAEEEEAKASQEEEEEEKMKQSSSDKKTDATTAALAKAKLADDDDEEAEE